MTYLWQCIECGEFIYSGDITLWHCGRLTQWIAGVEGRGLDMNSPVVKIQVSGYVTMTKENLERSLAGGKDEHMGLVYALHMGYVDVSKLEFELPD